MAILKRSLLPLAMILLVLAMASRAIAQEHPAAAGAAAEHAAGEAGHPEIDERLVPIPPSRDTIVSSIWVIVIFVVMLAILYPTAWKNILAGLKAREERIRADLANAEAAKKKAEEQQKQLEAQLAAAEARVRDIIAKGTADAERIATTLKQQATTEVEAQRERATKDIEAAKSAAIAEVYSQTAELATSIAGKIIQRNLNADDQREIVNRSLEQLQNL